MKIRSNAVQILEENNTEEKLRDYVEISAEADPNFFRWLFQEDFKNDFDTDLTEAHRNEYKEFLNTL